VEAIDTTALIPDLILSGTELYRPVSVSLDALGTVYVLDEGNSRVYVYGPAGTLLREVGKAGQGPGEFHGLGSRSRLLVADGLAIVLQPLAQRIQVFELPDWRIRSTFGVTALPISVGFDGSEIHMALRSLAGNLPKAQVYRFSLEGDLLGTYGETLQPSWDEPEAPRKLHSRNEAKLTVQGDTVFVALRWWPSLRAFRDGKLVTNEWLSFDWLKHPGYSEIFDRPSKLVDHLDVETIDSSRSLSAPVNFDIASSADRLFMLMNGGGFLLVLDKEGKPLASYELRGPGSSPELRADLNVPFVDGFQIAVSPDGRRVCVPLQRRAAVFCYDLGADS
jgi:hypothetical protein